MNLSVNVTINASPELMGALQSIATALTGTGQIQVEKAAPVAPVATTPAAPVAQPPAAAPVAPAPAPIQQQPMAPVTAVPTAGQAPVTPTPAPAPNPAAVPTTTQTYTMEQLAVAATQLMDAGRRNEVVNLLAAYGVQALTALPKEQYGAFATSLRSLGAKI